MRLLIPTALALLATSANAFAPAPICRRNTPALFMSEAVVEAEIPTNLPSDVGMDYVPLATMLATGQLAEADQVRGGVGALGFISVVNRLCLSTATFPFRQILDIPHFS